ncbi:uncharacterized protein LOC144118836 [Amblyomma americanum]
MSYMWFRLVLGRQLINGQTFRHYRSVGPFRKNKGGTKSGQKMVGIADEQSLLFINNLSLIFHAAPSARTSLPAACSVAAIGPVPSSRDRFSPSKECLELPNARHEPDLTNALGTPAAVSADFSESAVKFTATSESCSPSEVHQEVPYTPHEPSSVNAPSEVHQEVPCTPHEQSSVNASQQALLERISDLERAQKDANRKLQIAKRRYLKCEAEKEQLQKKIKHLFNDDQMSSMERLSSNSSRWEADTLVKSLRLRLACGTRGYNLLRDYGYPLPSERTLQRHIEHAKFRPGILIFWNR